MIYVTFSFLLISIASFFMVPLSFSREFCIWEMVTFMIVAVLFLQHKVRRNGIICFDMFFIPTFLLINYAHAVFIYPDDGFLPPFQFPTNTELIPYAVSVAQMGIAFYMFGNILFEKDVQDKKVLKAEIPKMAVNRIAIVSFIASLGVFCYVIVLRLAAAFQHLYPRLMTMILCLIALSWFFQAQQLEPEDHSLLGMLRKNKFNIASTLLFSVSQLFIGSRAVVLFLLFILLLLVNIYYFRIRFRLLLPAMLLGMFLMGFLAIIRVSSYNLSNVNFIDAFKYGVEVIIDSLMGTSYVQYLFVFVPMGGSYFTKLLTGLDMDEVRTGNILTSFSDATYGLGTNMVGDLYMNFSFLGVVILMFLLGMLVARVEIPKSKYQLYAYMALFANCIYLVRADIFSWLTFFVFFLIFDWLLRIHIVYDEDITD